MKISTKGRYGLEALLDLAIHSSEEHVNLKVISERCRISEAYLLQIFLILKNAGIVESIRGAQGGYKLRKDPANITVGEILNVLEGPISPVECIIEDTDKPCDRYSICITRVLWENIKDRLADIANSITVSDLIKSYHDLNCRTADLDYYI